MSLARVTILGSGTSTGVPVIGKTYPQAYLDNPKNHRMRCSIVIHGPEGNLLVDCPPDMRTQCLTYQVTDIDAVLITHTHADHVMGMDDLRAFCQKTGRPMKVYARPEHIQDIKRVFKYMFQDFPPEISVPRIDLTPVTPLISEAGLDIETFTVNHGSSLCTALRVGDFAYVTDVKSIPDDVMPRLHGLQTLVLDAVRYKPHPNHLSYAEAIAVAQELNPRQTYFTHLCDDYDHDITNSQLPKGIELAYDGLEITVNG